MLNLRSSCYSRSTFSIATPAALAALDTLGLRMRYNDGFVAYLNSTKIAERNAPAAPTWNSLATATRDDAASMVPEAINATAFKSALIVGTNVLAVHGLNVTLDSSSFLMLPELTGGELQSGAPAYFAQSTPGALNSTPASLGPVADTVSPQARLYAAPSRSRSPRPRQAPPCGTRLTDRSQRQPPASRFLRPIQPHRPRHPFPSMAHESSAQQHSSPGMIRPTSIQTPIFSRRCHLTAADRHSAARLACRADQRADPRLRDGP